MLLEVACDESGSEGEKLIGGNTDVFAHASVALSAEAAAACMRELRDRARSPAEEYKANILLRSKHRETLKWLLGPAGPLLGAAHVHLTDKPFLFVGKVVALLVPDDAEAAAATAAALYRDGRRMFGRAGWEGLLGSFNDIMRARNRMAVDPATIPALDPLIPAIVQAVVHWGAGQRAVSVVHDEQSTLTEERVSQLKEIFTAHPSGGRLAGLCLADSRFDARIQVADLLAGTARKIAEEELNGRGDAELTALLRPYVDAHSIWGDDRSRATLLA